MGGMIILKFLYVNKLSCAEVQLHFSILKYQSGLKWWVKLDDR